MNKRMNLFNRVILGYMVLLFTYLFICGVLQTYLVIDYTFIANGFILMGIVGTLVYFLYKAYIDKRIRIQDVFVIMLFLFTIISYYNAYDRRIALLGFIAGREGLFVILSYYIVFLVSSVFKDMRYIKYVIWIVSIYGVLNVFYGILQTYEINNILGIIIINDWSYVTGFLANSNFYGSYMILLYGVWCSIYLFRDKDKIYIVDFIMMFIFCSGLFLSSTMSSIVGLISIIVVLFIIVFILNKKRYYYKRISIRLISVFLVIVISYIWVSSTPLSTLNKDIAEVSMQVSDSVSSGVKDEYGTGRIAIWKQILDYLPKYIYTGIGIDQIYYLGGGGKIIDPIMNVPAYKAHNEYLQILMTEGIFKFLTYVGLLGWILLMFFISLVRNKDVNKVSLIFISSFVGYSVQAFFNVSIIRVIPVFFLICGLVVSTFDSEGK